MNHKLREKLTNQTQRAIASLTITLITHQNMMLDLKNQLKDLEKAEKESKKVLAK